MTEKLRREARQLLVVVGLDGLSISFVFAVYTMYLLAKGMTLMDAAVVNMCYHLAVPLLEIPTGAVADIWGRKRSFLASTIVWVVCAVTYGISSSMLGFIAAEVLAAIATSLASGCLDAHIWDVVADRGSSAGLCIEEVQSLNHTVTSWIHATNALAAAVGGALGAWLYTLNISFPWYATGIGFALTYIAAKRLLPKDTACGPNGHNVISAIVEITAVSWRGVKISMKNKPLRQMVLFSVVNSLALAPFFMFWQPRFSGLIGKTLLLGLMWVLIETAKVAGGQLAERLKHKVNRYPLMAVSTGLVAVCGLVAAISSQVLTVTVAFLALELLLGSQALGAKVKNQVDITDSGHGGAEGKKNLRATILSANSMAKGVGSSVGLLAAGFLSQHLSIGAAWVLGAAVLAAETLMIIYWMMEGDS